MSKFKNSLDQVRIASPCNVDWDSMFGNERVRFCGQCKLNVFNLSEMTRSDAERLVATTEARLCVRYYQRRDGSIITQNCPVGLAAVKRRLTRVASAIGSAVLTFFAGLGMYGVADRWSLVSHRYYPTRVMGGIGIQGRMVATPPVEPVVKMGDMVKREPAGRKFSGNVTTTR